MSPRPGFGEKQPHCWGFDRYDGGTLNRFVNVDPVSMAACRQFAGDSRLAKLSRAITGMALSPTQAWVYLTLNGDQVAAPDLQKVLHRDTFFSSMKFWYYLDPVTEADGPFVYVPGSHKLTPERLLWEHKQAIIACQAAGQSSALTSEQQSAVDGSFRKAVYPDQFDRPLAIRHTESISYSQGAIY